MKLKEIIKIERKVIIGLITNTKYLKQAVNLVHIENIQSKEAKIIASWVFEYFNKYKKAPKDKIQAIYMDKLSNKRIQKDQAQIIEEILDNLSEESIKSKTDVQYLLDITEPYCKSCQLRNIAEQIEDEIDNGNINEAEQLVTNFKPVENIKSNAVTPLGSLQQIKDSFESFGKPLIKYPGALGSMLNQYMVPESFACVLAQNKGKKSFFLMDAAIRAAKQGKKVTIYQAGDMSQAQMERRQAIYLAKKSDLKQYCGKLYIPILDCVYNQNGECDQEIREGEDIDAPFDGMDFKKIREDITAHELKEAYKDYHDHVPCYNCLRTKQYNKFKGSIWYKERDPVEPLNWKDVYKLVKKKHKHLLDKIKLITYSSESLTMNKIRMEDEILRKTGFVSQIDIVDYFDLLAPDKDTLHLPLRDQINTKWQRGRGFSQDKKSLLLTASQSDADGFKKRFLEKGNFNNDRRILDHVTAMFGINMSIEEKKKGISRINDIAARETEGASFVYLFHRLQIGRPILGVFINNLNNLKLF